MSVSVQLSQVTKMFGEIPAVEDMNLEITDGEFFSMLGPSGCGKTTTLRMIAGFEQPTAGSISIMGQQVAGVPAHRRPVNTVFQNYALFPHMNVFQNVAFGLEMAGVSKNNIKSRVQNALELVQMTHFEKRKPAQMSGGQRQRVALARALVNRPKVLLLDEPLGALDLKLRKAMQLELKQIQSDVGITFIYVTHDQEEALTMSDRIAVMNEGRIMQIGSPHDIYERPNNTFVADFIGETNFLSGVINSNSSPVVVDVGGLALTGVALAGNPKPGAEITLAIRPEKIHLYDLDESFQTFPVNESSDTIVSGLVEEVIYIGTDTRYRIALAEGIYLFVREQNHGFGAEHNFAVGEKLKLHWRAEHAQVLFS